MFFREKFYKNILSFFPKIVSQIFEEFGQKRLILHDFSKLKNLPIYKNWVGHARKIGFSFSWPKILESGRFTSEIIFFF